MDRIRCIRLDTYCFGKATATFWFSRLLDVMDVLLYCYATSNVGSTKFFNVTVDRYDVWSMYQ